MPRRPPHPAGAGPYIRPSGADLSLDALAEGAAIGRFRCHRRFRVLTGGAAAQAVRRIRPHRTSVALVQTALPPDQGA